MEPDPTSTSFPVPAPAPAPAPLVPDYSGAGLTGLVPALSAPPGSRPGWLPGPLVDARQVVLLVLDGLGWEQLAARVVAGSATAPAMAAMQARPITAVAPTTTATSLTSIVTGSAPADHGVVGYRVKVQGPSGDEVLNVLRWRTASGDARKFVPPRSFLRRQAFAGRSVPVVSKSDFAGSGFSDAHLAGTRLAAWSVASSIRVEVRRLLAAGEPLVYAYYDGVDKVAHVTGLGEHYEAELAAADRLVADILEILPEGAALAVTADHGEVEVGERARPLDASLLDHCALVSGEGRFRWLHAKRGRAHELLEAARDCYGAEAWVRSVDEVDRAGWLGTQLCPEDRSRLGDVAVVPWEPVAYLDPADGGDAKLACRHGSLTPAEMLVPLLAAGGTARPAGHA